MVEDRFVDGRMTKLMVKRQMAEEQEDTRYNRNSQAHARGARETVAVDGDGHPSDSDPWRVRDSEKRSWGRVRISYK